MAPFLSDDMDRLDTAGPVVPLGSAAIQPIGLAIHELATNAVKYGALSNDGGRIAIEWRVEDRADRPSFNLCWREAGGPRVTSPGKTGFGSQLIQRMIQRALNAETRLEFAEGGLIWTLDCPLDALSR